MKLIYISKKKAIRVLLAIYLVLLPIVFVENIDKRTISAFLNTSRQLPIYSVETSEKKIAISFDAAWGAEYTSEIMDIVEARGIKTTFFLVKFWAEKNADKVKEIAQRGHELANHSASHPHMKTLSKEQMINELVATQDKIRELAGNNAVMLFRPPFGEYNDLLINTCRELGIYPIQWDVDSLDWQEKGVDHIYNRVVNNVGNGSIVLFHNNAKYITQALPLILDELIARGYEIVPVSELIYKDNYRIDHTGRQIKNDN